MLTAVAAEEPEPQPAATPVARETLVGTLVLYKLVSYDADAINKRREDARFASASLGVFSYAFPAGNRVKEGDVFPAVIVADWGPAKNLQVFLDGNDTYWATSRTEGIEPCQWTRLRAS